MIALPMDTGPTALFYRADLFEQAGLPSDPEEVHKLMGTWDDYFAAGQKLQEALGGKVKLTDNIGNIYTQVNAQSDKIYFDKNENFIGEDSSSSMKKAWDLAVKASQMGLLANASTFFSEWNAAANNGKIASFVGAVWCKEILMQAAPDTSGKWRVARAPGGDGNNGGSFLAIMKTSKHPQEAFDVIKWLQNPENQVTSFKEINLFLSAKKALDSDVMKQKEAFFGGQVTGEIFFGVCPQRKTGLLRHEICQFERHRRPGAVIGRHSRQKSGKGLGRRALQGQKGAAAVKRLDHHRQWRLILMGAPLQKRTHFDPGSSVPPAGRKAGLASEIWKHLERVPCDISVLYFVCRFRPVPDPVFDVSFLPEMGRHRRNDL
ncbi:extracellular solute-binding protein [Paenibacillus sp. JTLBN-2024]